MPAAFSMASRRPCGPPCRARHRGGRATRIPRPVLDGTAPRRLHGLPLQLGQVVLPDAPEHLRADPRALLDDQLPQARDRRLGHIVRRAHLIEVEQRHVELTHRTQRASQPANRLRERLSRPAVRNERDRLADAPCRHARLMHRVHVSLPRSGQRTAQRGQSLADQELGWIRALHDGVTRLDLL